MSRTTLIGQTLGGRYRIDEILGQGGMSAVYKAYDPNLKRVVAVKVIHPHLLADENSSSRGCGAYRLLLWSSVLGSNHGSGVIGSG